MAAQRPALVTRGERPLRRLRSALKRALGVAEPLRLLVYGGYGGTARAFVWGRALKNGIPRPPQPGDGLLDNLQRSLTLLHSEEVAGVTIRVRWNRAELVLNTDAEGYFCAELPNLHGDLCGSCEATAEVVDPVIERTIRATGPVYAGAPQARFAVVSDIDDTILQSHVQSKPKQAFLLLFGNALTRLSYPDTPELFASLERASAGGPCFYVSRSAWNIHMLLEHFLRLKRFPQGPLVLRDVRLFNPPEDRRGHKRRELERILTTVDLPLVLIGDSGQADAEIYMDIARAHPGRVAAVLIRDVTGRRRRQRVLELFSSDTQIPCVLFKDAEMARRFCARLGLAA